MGRHISWEVLLLDEPEDIGQVYPSPVHSPPLAEELELYSSLDELCSKLLDDGVELEELLLAWLEELNSALFLH